MQSNPTQADFDSSTLRTRLPQPITWLCSPRIFQSHAYSDLASRSGTIKPPCLHQRDRPSNGGLLRPHRFLTSDEVYYRIDNLDVFSTTTGQRQHLLSIARHPHLSRTEPTSPCQAPADIESFIRPNMEEGTALSGMSLPPTTLEPISRPSSTSTSASASLHQLPGISALAQANSTTSSPQLRYVNTRKRWQELLTRCTESLPGMAEAGSTRADSASLLLIVDDKN